MVDVIISLAYLAALGSSGAAALGWLRAGLTRLEIAAYGLPLGMVFWTLVVLVVASLQGTMTLALVIAVGVASFAITVVALGIALRRSPELVKAPAWTSRLPSTRSSVGIVASPAMTAMPQTRTRRFAPWSLVMRLVRSVWFWPVVILGAFVIRWAFLWEGMFTVRDDALFVAQINVWGDWPQHVGDATSFAYGDNFPPEHPRFAGIPYAYHFLSSLTGAMLIRLGMAPVEALALHSFALSSLIALALFAFARRLIANMRTAALAVLLFLLGGGFGWILTIQDANENGRIWETIWNAPWNLGEQKDNHYWWENLYLSNIEPQRSVLYGLPLSLLILTLLFIAVRTRTMRGFVAAGVVVGLMPFAHLGALPALAIIITMMAVLLPTGSLRDSWRQWYPVRGWLAFGVIGVVLAAPQLFLQTIDQPIVESGFRWHIGWLRAENEPVWWFWLKNLGWFAPLLLIGLASPRLVRFETYRFLWAFMPIFVVCNLFSLQVDPLDNIKMLLYWGIALAIIAAVVIADAWRQERGIALRSLLVIVVAMMLVSGSLVNLQQARGLDTYPWVSTEEMALAEQVAEETDPHSVFVTSTRHSHPIHMLAGRAVVMSYWGWMYTRGFETEPREEALRQIYALAPDHTALLEQYDVDYVVIGPDERSDYEPDEAAWRAAYPVAFETENYVIFAVSPEAQEDIRV